MAIGKEFVELQDKLGYKFRDLSLLESALTHSSYSNEQRAKGIVAPSNERLEFLGDAILQLVVSEHLYEKFKNRSEGTLTKMRQHLVCEKTLSKIAAELDLGIYLNLGRGEELTDCRHRPKVLCDAMEAVFAAMYLDCGGNATYKEVIRNIIDAKIEEAEVRHRGDAKTILQQLVEKDGSSLLEYRIIDEAGPDHNKTFTVVAVINNNLVGKGISSSKKDAEMRAAEEALRLFGVID